MKLGKIVRVHEGEVQDLGTSARDGLLEIIGLDVDPVRRRVWAVMGRDNAEPGAPHDFGEAPRDNGIVAYDLNTGARVVHHRRPATADETIHMWNDVSVAPDGTAYFTDMTTGQIWRLAAGGRPEVFHQCALVDHINGLAVSSDGRRLYVAGLEDVLVIDLPGGGHPRLLRHGDDLCCGLGDGMAVRGNHMFIVQNNGLLGERILHLRLSPDGESVEEAEPLFCGLPEGLMSYTCALGDGVLYINGTAPFAAYDSEETPAMPVIVETAYGLD